MFWLIYGIFIQIFNGDTGEKAYEKKLFNGFDYEANRSTI